MRNSHPIRIAFVVHSFGVGGLERCVAHLVNRLPPDFVSHVVALQGIEEARQWIERPNIVFHDLQKLAGNDPRVVWRLTRFLKSHSIDIVHSHNWGTLLETVAAARLAGCTHVHAEHGLDYGRSASGLRGWFRKQLRRAANRRVHALVAVAQAVEDWLRENFCSENQPIHLLRNGVAKPQSLDKPEARDRLRNALHLPTHALLIGAVGRLVHVKGFDLALRAFSQVDTTAPVHLALVGDGPEAEKLQSLTGELQISERVHFVGHQSNVGEWLSAFDVFLNSSRSEAMSLSILEAMCAGLPVVAADVGDNRYLLENPVPCGLLFPAEEVDQMRHCLESMVADAGMRAQFKIAGLKAFEDMYTLDAMVHRYAELYRALASKGNGPPCNLNERRKIVDGVHTKA